MRTSPIIIIFSIFSYLSKSNLLTPFTIYGPANKINITKKNKKFIKIVLTNNLIILNNKPAKVKQKKSYFSSYFNYISLYNPFENKIIKFI